MDEADKRLGKPQNHTQTVIHKYQLPIPCLGLLAAGREFGYLNHPRGIFRISEFNRLLKKSSFPGCSKRVRCKLSFAKSRLRWPPKSLVGNAYMRSLLLPYAATTCPVRQNSNWPCSHLKTDVLTDLSAGSICLSNRARIRETQQMAIFQQPDNTLKGGYCEDRCMYQTGSRHRS